MSSTRIKLDSKRVTDNLSGAANESVALLRFCPRNRVDSPAGRRPPSSISTPSGVRFPYSSIHRDFSFGNSAVLGKMPWFATLPAHRDTFRAVVGEVAFLSTFITSDIFQVLRWGSWCESPRRIRGS